MQENDVMGTIVIPAAALDRAAAGGDVCPQDQEIAIPPCPPINTTGLAGEIVASGTETPIVSRAVLACYTREPPPDWSGDPLAPSPGEVE